MASHDNDQHGHFFNLADVRPLGFWAVLFARCGIHSVSMALGSRMAYVNPMGGKTDTDRWVYSVGFSTSFLVIPQTTPNSLVAHLYGGRSLANHARWIQR